MTECLLTSRALRSEKSNMVAIPILCSKTCVGYARSPWCKVCIFKAKKAIFSLIFHDFRIAYYAFAPSPPLIK